MDVFVYLDEQIHLCELSDKQIEMPVCESRKLELYAFEKQRRWPRAIGRRGDPHRAILLEQTNRRWPRVIGRRDDPHRAILLEQGDLVWLAHERPSAETKGPCEKEAPLNKVMTPWETYHWILNMVNQ